MDVTLGIAVSSNPTFNITVNHTALEADIQVTMYVADGGREDIAFALEFVSKNVIHTETMRDVCFFLFFI